MKHIAYKLFACSFNLCALLPARKRVALLSPHMASFTDSLGEMEREMRGRGCQTVRISGADIRKLLDLPPEEEKAPVLSGEDSGKPGDNSGKPADGASAPAEKKDDGGDPPKSGDEVSVKTF